jgi:hypothetical protein
VIGLYRIIQLRKTRYFGAILYRSAKHACVESESRGNKYELFGAFFPGRLEGSSKGTEIPIRDFFSAFSVFSVAK